MQGALILQKTLPRIFAATTAANIHRRVFAVDRGHTVAAAGDFNLMGLFLLIIFYVLIIFRLVVFIVVVLFSTAKVSIFSDPIQLMPVK